MNEVHVEMSDVALKSSVDLETDDTQQSSVTRAFFFRRQAVYISMSKQVSGWCWSWALASDAKVNGSSVRSTELSRESAHAAAKLDAMAKIENLPLLGAEN